MPQFVGSMSMCPFYQCEKTSHITCEGTEEAQYIKLSFSTSKEKMDWQRKYCLKEHYKSCPICQIVSRKYE